MGLCRPILQIQTLFQTKNCHFSCLFSDLAYECLVKAIALSCVLQTEIMLKNSHNSFFFFFFHSFGIETINTFLHSRSSLENHTRFQTKMSKVYTRFQSKKRKNPTPLGWHIPLSLTFNNYSSSPNGNRLGISPGRKP